MFVKEFAKVGRTKKAFYVLTVALLITAVSTLFLKTLEKMKFSLSSLTKFRHLVKMKWYARKTCKEKRSFQENGITTKYEKLDFSDLVVVSVKLEKLHRKFVFDEKCSLLVFFDAKPEF